MIDPFISLAFSLYSNRGAFAVLAGSGVSRSAGIPTGWEIVEDLIKGVAKLEGAEALPDPITWFKDRFGFSPDYRRVLDLLAKTPSERQQLLRPYFEPTAEERALNRKMPTVAHRSIATLMANGYIRVILTTNFDRLFELALEDVGVAPTVISSAEHIAGALPLVHSRATVIKLHGDYRDTRIKNTEAELAQYSRPMRTLLARVLDEFGLIICGWSAEWDIALKAAIEACPSRRFATYWTSRAPLGGAARDLASHRNAEILTIRDADHFFESLLVKVESLGEVNSSHPLSAKLATATLKRYLVDPASAIRMRDLLHEETERVCVALNNTGIIQQSSSTPANQQERIVAQYDAICDSLLALIITGAYWGKETEDKLWSATLERVGRQPGKSAGATFRTKLQKYPVLLLMYAAGIAALAANKYHTLLTILKAPQVPDEPWSEPQSLCYSVDAIGILLKDGKLILHGRQTPHSEFMQEKLREPLRGYIPDDRDYQILFDRFEYILGLARFEKKETIWAPVGSFAWRGKGNPAKFLPDLMKQELLSQKEHWPLLRAGLFGGAVDQAMRAMSDFDKFLAQVGFH